MRSDIAAGRRRLPLDGWRPHLDAHRPPRTRSRSARIARRIRATRSTSSSPLSAIPTAPTRSAASSARRDGGRELAEGALARTTTPAPSTSPSSPAIPERDLRRAVADAAHALERLPAVERAGRRPVQVHGRRRDLDAARRPRPARTRPGNIGLAVGSQPPRARLRDRRAPMRAATGGAAIAPTTRGATWTQASGDRRTGDRGWYFGNVAVEPRNPDTRLCAQHGRCYRSRRRRARRSCRSRATPGGDDYHDMWIDPRRIPSGASSAPTRARSSRSTAARPGAPGTTSRRRRCTT